MVKASDCKCSKCKTKQAIAFWPIVDIDIRPHPYCRECLEAERIKLLMTLYDIPDTLDD